MSIKISLTILGLILGTMIAAITTTQPVFADKEKTYCGPVDPQTQGCTGTFGSNQQWKDLSGESNKKTCEGIHEDISGEETKCRQVK